jgi:hypothetical protein
VLIVHPSFSQNQAIKRARQNQQRTGPSRGFKETEKGMSGYFRMASGDGFGERALDCFLR